MEDCTIPECCRLLLADVNSLPSRMPDVAPDEVEVEADILAAVCEEATDDPDCAAFLEDLSSGHTLVLIVPRQKLRRAVFAASGAAVRSRMDEGGTERDRAVEPLT